MKSHPTRSLRSRSFGLCVLPLALTAAAGCDAPEDQAVAEVQSAVTTTVSIVGRVSLTGLVATPGITVTLTGSQQQTVVTDANGAFKFQVPAGGSYSIFAVKAGAFFTPDVVNLNNLAADTIRDFTCSGACGGTTAVVAAKELVINDPTVLADARASNATGGAWSFRFLMEQMAPVGTDPADFAAAWLSQFEIPNGTINGFTVPIRNTSNVRGMWPTTANGKLDLSRAPFRLLAIVNRTDLHAANNGEGRFVYGVVDLNGAGQSMSVIFEYGLPAKDPTNGATLTRKSWATKFHALGTQAFGASYNAALQAVTDLFTKRNTSPLKPGGSSINQVRSNEIMMGFSKDPWQLREFHLDATGGPLALRLSTTAMTPSDNVFGAPALNQMLVDYLNGSAALIHGGYASVPAATIGGHSNQNFKWFFGGVSEQARHDFAGQTCNGCHSTEQQHPQTGEFLSTGFFYQVSPVDGSLSAFMRNFEIPRRTTFMQNVLTCSGSACSAGAEPTFL